MKFYTCVCVFDCYAYLCNVKSKEQIVTILSNRPQKNVAVLGKRFIFCDQIFCVDACHICLFLLLKIKKFNVDRINEILQKCWIYLGDLTISRVKGHTNTCFECYKHMNVVILIRQCLFVVLVVLDFSFVMN